VSELLAPPASTANARPSGRLGFGFGPRFFFLLALGLFWTVPAFWDRRFLYAMAVWDAVVLAAFLVDLWQLPRPHELVVERHWPAAPALATDARIELVVRNAGAGAVHCALTDTVPVQLTAAVPVVNLEAKPRRPATGSYRIRPLQRGDVHMGDVYLKYQSDARLAERWARADLRQGVRIYPDLQMARQHSMYLTRSRQIELEKRLLRQRGMGREFESLREYQDGDEFRDICWTATARRGKLVTKLHQMERSQTVWVVVDTGRLLRAQVGDVNKLDHACNAALTLAQLALFSGDRVGLLAYGRATQQRVPPGRGPAHLRVILEGLASVQPETAEGDHLRAAGALLTAQKRRGLIVWLTDLAETAMTPEVIEGASRLLSRHLVLFVVIANPELARAAAERPRDPEEMFKVSAAQEMMQRRDLLLARLRERGALALEIEPKGLTTALVNQYLAIKERSLL
jgi:uncharacterized protein (DUF58 family)